MTKTDTRVSGEHPSVVPYVQSEHNGIRIDFCLSRDRRPFAFPFETLENTDPLSHLVKARLVTDAGSEIENLLVLVQRDQVLDADSSLMPAANPAVGRCWQKAFHHFSENAATAPFMIKLGAQLAADGHLLPFQPLLFCIHRRRFFPPLCPVCGAALDLCRDDEMLVSAGLRAYSRSLQRYLFCPTCYQLAGQTDFYCCRPLQTGGGAVRGVPELITALTKLAASNRHIDRFPCPDCIAIGDCHAPEGPMSMRVSPFAFYPFHLIAFRAGGLPPDNLQIMEAGRQGIPKAPEPEPESGAELESRVQPQQAHRDGTLEGILRHIIDEWRKEAVETAARTPPLPDAAWPGEDKTPDTIAGASNSPPQTGANPDFQQTRIAAVRRGQAAAGSAGSAGRNGDFPETVIVTSRQLKPDRRPGHNAADKGNLPFEPMAGARNSNGGERQASDDIPETVIIRPDGSGIFGAEVPEKTIDHGASGMFTFKRDDLSAVDVDDFKTFTLGLRKRVDKPPGKNREPSLNPPEKNRGTHGPQTTDGLPETVIVRPSEKNGKKK